MHDIIVCGYNFFLWQKTLKCNRYRNEAEIIAAYLINF